MTRRPGSPPGHVSLRRWERYGFDRLYGSADGRTVGWVDLGTGEERIEIPELAEAFGFAVEDWRNSHLIGGRPPTRSRQAAGSPPPGYPRVNRSVLGDVTSGAVEEWTDLALNLPGAGVRAKAVEARRREPVWTLLARLGRCHNDERAWRLGAKGEELVGRELAKLRDDWRVLHSIPLGDHGDIDHLVIGPGGVFVLNAKFHKYATVVVDGEDVFVNGQPYPYVRAARRQARRVESVLSGGLWAAARAAVVVVNAGDLSVHAHPLDVEVIDKRQVRRWMLSQPRTLDQSQVVELFDVARWSSSWHAWRVSWSTRTNEPS
jgi:hypothetical protein